MPELPDLENFKQYFKSTSLHKKIEDIKSTDRSLIYGAVFDDFKEELEGKSFADVSRRGKFLVAEVENSKKKYALIIQTSFGVDLFYILLLF